MARELGTEFALDSPLEGNGFEPSVPRANQEPERYQLWLKFARLSAEGKWSTFSSAPLVRRGRAPISGSLQPRRWREPGSKRCFRRDRVAPRCDAVAFRGSGRRRRQRAGGFNW